ncbi:MAG: zinc metallopeptidase [Treponema sp.]|jgi:Zn-dependent membrane protease YugP|nr:zinc metallopeptidase [Treponema sp.]
MFFDYYYLVLVVPTLILSMWAQFKVKSTFNKYSKISCSRKITGSDAAALLLKAHNINNVKIEAVRGALTDHYDPSSKKVRLSDPVYGSTSIAAIGVAAHEAGHAIQHATRWSPLVMRSTLVPVANIGSRFGPILAIIGLFISGDPAYDSLSSMLFTIGILLFTGAVVFYLITLPVEFNASNRAIAILRANNVLNEKELNGVKSVLTAAALTYVASALTAIASLVRLILLSRRRR